MVTRFEYNFLVLNDISSIFKKTCFRGRKVFNRFGKRTFIFGYFWIWWKTLWNTNVCNYL